MTQPAGGAEQQPAPTPGPTPTPTPTPPAGEQNPPDPNSGKTFTQEDFNRFEARVKREYREKAERDADLIEKGKKLEAQEQEQQPLAERVSTQATAIAERDQKITALEADKIRYREAAIAGLDPVLWDRIRGNTEDEIKADIETLKPVGTGGATPPATPGTPGRSPIRQQGVPSEADGKTGSLDAGRDLFKSKRAGNRQEPATQ